MSRLSVGLVALVLAGSSLAALWATGSLRNSPPIYDGLPLQTEPYRYLQPSPGQATTAPPTSASENVKPFAANLPFIVNTGESPPQAELQAAQDGFDVAPAVQSLTIAITPVPPAAPVPRGKLDGNVYRMTVTSPDGAAVGVRPGRHVTVFLRGTGMSGKPTMERLANGHWVALSTITPGSGFHAADSDALGDFALVLPPGSGGLSGGLVAGIAVAASLVAVGLLFAGVRRMRR